MEERPPPKPKSSPENPKPSRKSIHRLINPAGVGGRVKRKKRDATKPSLERRPVRKEGRESEISRDSLPSPVISLGFSLPDLAPEY